MAKTIIINVPGPQGPVGPQGPAGDPGNFDASALVTTSSFNTFTSSYNIDSASFDSRINNSSFNTSSLVTTASFNSFTASYVLDSASFNSKIANLTSVTSSYVLNSQTSSFVTTSSFNNFTSSYNTGSFTGSFSGSLFGTSSWAYSASQAITASYISPTFISASAAASGFGSGGGGSTTLIDTIGFRIYTDDTYITSGLKAYKHIGYNSTITKTRSIANTNGYIDINVKRNGSTLGTISLSNQSSSLDTTLTGWTTTLNTDDLLEFHVSQSSTYITDISIFIDIQST